MLGRDRGFDVMDVSGILMILLTVIPGIRQNMMGLDRTSELHRRYYQKLSDYEDQLEMRRKEVEQIRGDERKQLADPFEVKVLGQLLDRANSIIILDMGCGSEEKGRT